MIKRAQKLQRRLFKRNLAANNCMSNSYGFSLAEAMVAIAVLALIATLTYGTFSRAIDARERTEKITSHYNEIRQAMLRMTKEISQAFLSRHKNCTEPRSDTLFIASQHSSGMRIDFTSFSHLKIKKDAAESDQNALSYYLDRDPDEANKLVLMRREKNRINEDLKADGHVDIIAHDIEELNFSFYNAKEDRWEDEWDTTSSNYKGRMPLFVRIEIKAKDYNGQLETFVTKTRIFLQKPILIFGTGFSAPADGC
ncbi:MAG: prepilin-type N-terminal cleavage/methylation domain-containing protein [Deltaproteobacteria bacterium]|nr:prepilin-type N-terminal cleavage/methylation domain-containing protein [Deltaproteobacteria bacterium]